MVGTKGFEPPTLSQNQSLSIAVIYKVRKFINANQKAIVKKTGARGLRSILESILLKTMFDLPSQDNVEEVIIDHNSVLGLSEPLVVHSKNKNKTQKTTAA